MKSGKSKQFLLRLQPLSGFGWSTSPEQRLRGLLKLALRRFGLRCVECRPDEKAAADWIDANQLGRRNLSADQASLLRGRRYNRTKKKHGGKREPRGQNDPLKSAEKLAAQHGGKREPRRQNDALKTADRLAAQHGVSARTIKRDGAFATAVENVKAADPEIERKVIE